MGSHNDVDGFLRDVHELEERTRREDALRAKKIERDIYENRRRRDAEKPALKRATDPDEDRFARMNAREKQLQHLRQEELTEIALSKEALKTEDDTPPPMPKRPGSNPSSNASTPQSKPKPKPGFINSALRHHAHDSTPEPVSRESPVPPSPRVDSSRVAKSSPQPPSSRSSRSASPSTANGSRPSWLSSALNKQPIGPAYPPRPKQTPAGASASKLSSTHSDKPKQHVKPVHKPHKDSVAAAEKPANEKPANEKPAKPRTPSEQIRSARANLHRSPQRSPQSSPERSPGKAKEDPLKEFREQLVLKPIPKPEHETDLTPSKVRTEKTPAVPPPRKVPSKPLLQKREPSVPEALKHLKSLKHATPISKAEPPSPEALERSKSLRAPQKFEKLPPPSPEALEVSKKLRAAQKPQKVTPPSPEALEKKKSLRPAEKPQKETPPSPEALEKMKSLRRAEKVEKPKPAPPEALERFKSLRAKPSKPSLKPSVTPQRPASTPPMDFASNLSKVLSRGPPAPASRSGSGSKLRRAATVGSTEVSDDHHVSLTHITKSRPRGPKRKLPTVAKTSSGRSTLRSSTRPEAVTLRSSEEIAREARRLEEAFVPRHSKVANLRQAFSSEDQDSDTPKNDTKPAKPPTEKRSVSNPKPNLSNKDMKRIASTKKPNLIANTN